MNSILVNGGFNSSPNVVDSQSLQVKGKLRELDAVSAPHVVFADTTQLYPTLHDVVLPEQHLVSTTWDFELPTPTNTEGNQLAEDDQLLDDVQVLPSLTAADIFFTVQHAQKKQPSSEELRERIIRQYPQLISAPESIVKPRKAHEPPPAVDSAVRARFKQTTPEQKKARELSLVLNVDEKIELGVIRGLVVLESRQGRWEKMADQPSPSASDSGIREVSELPTLPSVWLLPIDTAKMSAQHKKKSKKTFELLDYRLAVPCWKCYGHASIPCNTCAWVEADECFWCEGQGKRHGKPCEGCDGQRVYECRTCCNTGQVACTHCDSTGTVCASYFVDVKLRTIELPPIRVDRLSNPLISGPLSLQEDIVECARAKMAVSVNRLFEEQAGKPVPAVPVLAKCIWSEATQLVVSVWRPYHTRKSLIRRSVSSNKLAKAAPKPTEEGTTTRNGFDVSESACNGELRRFIVPCDPSAPIVELHNDARAYSANRSRRSSMATRMPSDMSIQSPPHSFFSIHDAWRDSASSSFPLSPAVSFNEALAMSADPLPSMARLSTTPAMPSMPSSPLSFSPSSSSVMDPTDSEKKTRKASFTALVLRRQRSAPDVAGRSSTYSGMRQSLSLPSPLTPAGPVTWSKR